MGYVGEMQMSLYPRVEQIESHIQHVMATGGEVEKQRLCEQLVEAMRTFSTYTWMKGMGRVSRRDDGGVLL